ncbi:MAG TPA: bifunctional phosphoglucose/phosphomannose isomerase [bacterium]|nr:bifunctional phosphoglucose/phosphomannose isomerase [bacterium]
MSVLDRTVSLPKLDPSGMLQKVMDVPYHCQDARYRVQNHPPKLKAKNIRSVVLSGLGGSAIGGDILRTLVWKSAAFSMMVNRHYELPGWVGKDSLVVCSSYSGNTEETLSVFRQALAKKGPVLVISSGGELLAQAKKKKLPYCEVPGGLPPRAALGYSFVTLLTALECLKLLPSHEADFQETLGLLAELSQRYGMMVPAAKNPAKQLAQFLHNKLPVLYAGQDHLDSVAVRWKCQFNENSKLVALANVVPEMNHNEVLGFSYPEVLSREMAVILLRHPQADHPQIQRRFEILKGILKSKTAGVREVKAEGKSLLAQMMSAIYLGDFVSVYLAYLRGIDPTPIDLIDQFKKQLSR